METKANPEEEPQFHFSHVIPYLIKYTFSSTLHPQVLFILREKKGREIEQFFTKAPRKMSEDIQVLQGRKIQGFCYDLERQKDKLRPVSLGQDDIQFC